MQDVNCQLCVSPSPLGPITVVGAMGPMKFCSEFSSRRPCSLPSSLSLLRDLRDISVKTCTIQVSMHASSHAFGQPPLDSDVRGLACWFAIFSISKSEIYRFNRRAGSGPLYDSRATEPSIFWYSVQWAGLDSGLEWPKSISNRFGMKLECHSWHYDDGAGSCLRSTSVAKPTLTFFTET